MSSSQRQSSIFLQSVLTEELSPESICINAATASAPHDDPLHLFEGPTATFDALKASSINPFLPFFENDYFGTLMDNGHDLATNVCAVPYDIGPDDLYAIPFLFLISSDTPIPRFGPPPAYISAFSELYLQDYNTHVPTDLTTTYENPPPTLSSHDTFAPTAQVSPAINSPITSVDPPTMMADTSYFDHSSLSSDFSIASPPSNNHSVASSPPTSPSPSSSYDSSETNTDYTSPSDEDNEEYRPGKSASYQKRRAIPQAKLLWRTSRPPRPKPTKKRVSSPRARRRSRPYKRNTPSRNVQCESGPLLTGDFRCPVASCGYIQHNRRKPDLRRHVATHERWKEPNQWICCGVGVDRALLHGMEMREGMTDDEWIEAGAYIYEGRLMIGGCGGGYARRDSLKRHLDHPKYLCVGDLD